jgi:diguanylate cyclase (GGDEF)-like protein/PAS domain S-box-containing protein
VLTAIKSLRPSIPVITVARAEDERIAAEALKEGVEAYIPKSGELAIRLRSSIRSALQRMEIEDRADKLEHRQRDILDRLNVGVFRASFGGQIMEANAAFVRLIGASSLEAAHELQLEDLFVDEAVHRGLLARLEEERQVRDFQAELRRGDRSTVWVSLTETLESIGSGERVIDGLAEDVTLARQAQEALRRANQDYRAVFEITSAATVILEEDSSISLANSAFERMSGYERDELEGKSSWVEFVAESDLDRVREQFRALHSDSSVPSRNVRFDFVNRDGRTLHVLATLAVLPGARRTVISLLNLTERQRVEEQLLHNAFHDGLTGLPNRLSMLDRMETLLSRDEADGGKRFALLLLGLDRFRVINDSLGHRIGDLLLQAVTRRLERACKSPDAVARCSGDVYGVLLHPIHGVEDATGAADAIMRALTDPFIFGDHEVHCTASFGIALSDRERDANELYRDAEAAMYEAKSAGRDRWVVFEPSMFEQAWHTFTVETELRRALASREIHVHFQPMATLSDGRVFGLEALVRWRRADGELYAPSHFLQVAEEAALIVPIGREVLQRACEQLRTWLDTDGVRQDLIVSVNLSARQLRHRELVRDVRRSLDEAGLPPANLMLEVADETLAYESEAVSGVLNQLGELGVRLCLDAFAGRGWSLANLHRFSFTTVKVDRSFLADIGDDERRWRTVDGIHALGLHLGMRVIVEGIEEQSQLRRLLDLGCTCGQGNLLSPAVDGDTAEGLLSSGVSP